MLNNRKEVIDTIKAGIFPYINGFKIKDESEEESEEELKDDVKKFIEYIENESKEINYDLLKKYFNFVLSSDLAKQLYATKDKNKNHKLEQMRNRWSN